MVDQALCRPAGMQGLLQRVEHEARRLRTADLPADDTPSEDVDDKGNIDHTAPGAHIEPVLGLDPRMKSETQSRFGAGAWNWRFT